MNYFTNFDVCIIWGLQKNRSNTRYKKARISEMAGCPVHPSGLTLEPENSFVALPAEPVGLLLELEGARQVLPLRAVLGFRQANLACNQQELLQDIIFD